MKIYFIHGAGDIAETDERANKLSNLFDKKIKRLSYFTDLSYLEIWQSLLDQLEDADNNCVFIGESYGGFWAAQLAVYFDACCYLLNPAMFPSWQLRQFVGTKLQPNRPELPLYNVLSTILANDPKSKLCKGRVGVMVGRNDNIIEPVVNDLYFTDICKIDWTNDSHAIELDESFELIKNRVSDFKAENKLCYLFRKVKRILNEIFN